MASRLLMKAMVSAVTLFCMATGAQADDVLAKVKAAGVLRVGTETAFAPFDYIDKDNGSHVGLNVDLFAEIGKELGVKIEWVALPWESVLPGLEAGKFDIVAGPATITKARAERYRFSPPIAEATVALLKRKGDTSVMKPADIAGKSVGSGKATAQLLQLQALAKTLPGTTDVREYVSFDDADADLAAGRIVAVANSLPNISYIAAQQPDIFEVVKPAFGTKAYFGFIENKSADYSSLDDAVNAAMLKIKADGRMATMQKKWFGDSFDTPDMITDPAL